MTYRGFCRWRGRPAKEVIKRALAREASLLGRWLSDGLPSWGKVETHLDRVNPFWGAEHLDGGASQAIAATKSPGHLTDAQVADHRRYLGCFLRRRPSYVMARAVGSIGGNEHGRLGNVVLLTVVGLLEAALDGDDPLGASHLQL